MLGGDRNGLRDRHGLAAQLADLSILDEILGLARNRLFRYATSVRLFRDGPGEVQA